MLTLAKKHIFLRLAVILTVQVSCLTSFAQSTGSGLNFRLINGSSSWQLLEKIPLQFDSYHPQGLVRIGDYFYLSSVETIEQPQALNGAGDNSRYDRSPGTGVGHLFKFDREGRLINQLRLGENNFYHPGGIDFDGETIWVSVAEYRPNSHSIVYRVDPDTLLAEEVFRFDDHLGAIIHDRRQATLHAISWGSEFYYSWRGSEGAYVADDYERTRAQGSTIEYQDCQYLPTSLMLCSGIGDYSIDNTHTFTVGGIELIDLDLKRVEHRITVTHTTPTGEFIVRNPSHFEFQSEGRSNFYFVPEDKQSNLYIYEVYDAP